MLEYFLPTAIPGSLFLVCLISAPCKSEENVQYDTEINEQTNNARIM